MFWCGLVIICLENGKQAVEKLASEGLVNAEAIQLDVTDEDSVRNARIEIGKKTDVLDILINNAGINADGIAEDATAASVENFKKIYETNVYGVVRVTTAFVDILKQSQEPRIVNVSSNMGSLALHSDPNSPNYGYKAFCAYSSSKSALNMYTIHLAYELRDTPFKVNAICPGLTKTDHTNFFGGDVVIAGQRIVKYALLDREGVTGKFISEELNPETGEIPW
ncbi:NAD(P)-dependent dehydrogenase (short-subunit alcohol dehydrogenase family) [Chryseobacterium nakagawai]|nr:NAD(P)-dependent dehydrogenase (short-subunit alcohol dehydrogenase family) [Chryseobacterium nakagawai]